MRLRTLLIAVVLVGGFVLYTSRDTTLRRFTSSNSDAPIWSGPSVAQSAGLGADEVNNIDVYRQAKDSVVYITSTVYQQNWFYGEVPVRELGSGFIINPEGQILTNNHVVSGSAAVEVTLPGDTNRYKADVLSRDRHNDLALIKIVPKRKLPFLPLGDSDRLQVGQKVLAIGNPFALAGTLTTGVISALKRPVKSENTDLEDMIQTDAAINQGNSGGPLLDSQGNVIGLNTLIYAPGGGNVGIGFAMPINRAKGMLDDFKAGKKPGRLGVSTVLVGGDLAEALKLPNTGGLLVQEVARGSSAASSGLKGGDRRVAYGNQSLIIGGDLITSIDGMAVKEYDSLSRMIQKKHAGDPMDLTIVRQGRTMNLKVTLSALEDQAF